MKKLTTILFLFSIIILNAQELTSKIPANVDVVVTLKTSKLKELLSVEEFNKSLLGKEMIDEFSNRDRKIESIEDFGINLQKSAYYFYNPMDSITYHALLVSISDASKFEKLFSKSKREKIEKFGNFNILKKEYNAEILLWNTNFLLFLNGDLSYSYFEDPKAMERYGLQDEYPQMQEYPEEISEAIPYQVEQEAIEEPELKIVTVEEVEEASEDETLQETEVEEIEVVVEEVEIEAVKDKVEEDIIIDDVPVEVDENVEVEAPPPPLPPEKMEIEFEEVEEAMVEDLEVEEAEPAYQSPYNNKYYEIERKNEKIKDSLALSWTLNKAQEIVNLPQQKSIINNTSYQKSIDRDAAASLWIANVTTLYKSTLSYFHGFYGMNSLINSKDVKPNTNSINSHLYLEENQARLKTNQTVSSKQAALYKKIANKKLNKKFLNYINQDKMIGYATSSINTQNLLEAYPQFVSDFYTGYGFYEKYDDEMELALEFLSIVIDEKEIGELLTGDMVFVFSDLSKREVEYTTYQYDDDYNRKEIQKTKTETVPDFLLMFSTKNTKFLNKVLKYGKKKEALITSQNGAYTLKAKDADLPFNLSLLVKDDILFIGTSPKEMNKIATNTYPTKLSKTHKKRMRKHSGTVFLNTKKLLSKLPEENMRKKEKQHLDYFAQNTEDFYAIASKIKGNTISSEAVLKTPKKYKNSLKYFFSMIDYLIEND